MDMAWRLLHSAGVLWKSAEPTLTSMSLSQEAIIIGETHEQQ
jgi:hypothetical protein